VRELAGKLGMSSAGAHHHIVTLRDKGALTPQKVTETRLLVSAKGRKAL
jgi:biotin operon repressor